MIVNADDPYDIAVVGLGPVGAAAALLLAAEGLRVLAVEPSPEPYDKPRALGMDHESLRMMQKIGIAEDLAPALGAYRPSEYRSGSGQLLRRIVAQPEPFPLSWPPYTTFVQPDLERLLRARFAEHAALDVAFGWRMTAVEQDADMVQLDVESTADEATKRVRCRYLVGCDGAWSPVREAAGLAFEDLGFDEPWLVVDVRVGDRAGLPEATTQYCDPRRPATFVPGPHDLCRWEIMLLPDEEPAAMLEDTRLWGLLARWLRPEQGKIWRAATYRFHALVATRFRHGRLLIAGDAAHQTPPFMAQGLNQGFRDVNNLCWKLGEVVRRGADPAILDTYDEERRPNARAVIELTKVLGKLICERDPAAAAARDARLLAEMDAGRGEILRQDLLPPLKPGRLICDDPAGDPPVTGSICPQPMVTTAGGPRRMDDVVPYRFLLLAFSNWSPDEGAFALAAFLGVTMACVSEETAPGLVPIDDRSGLLRDWGARHRLVAALVRPDHVVFDVARVAGRERQLLASLADALGHAERDAAVPRI